MDLGSINWGFVGLGILAALLLAGQVISWIRARGTWQDDPQVWSIIQVIMGVVKDLGSGVNPAEVEVVAGDVYDRLLSGSFLGKLATRDQFVDFVVDQWRRLTQIEQAGHVSARGIASRRLK